ncbi:MAG: peptidase C11, partial [Armatimonadetes bacterium]|nr:peptidase C11 [Armatimonadota bacterium]
EYNDDGDLIMEYDGTWLALNGQVVAYYMMSDDHEGDAYSIRGRVPALLNDQLVDIIVVFSNESPDGMVLGAQIKYDAATETETVARGLIDIVAGDKIDYLCDYYTYEGEYTDTYYLGNQYTATSEWTVENLSVGDNSYQMTYRFTDIYGNQYWTPPISD